MVFKDQVTFFKKTYKCIFKSAYFRYIKWQLLLSGLESPHWCQSQTRKALTPGTISPHSSFCIVATIVGFPMFIRSIRIMDNRQSKLDNIASIYLNNQNMWFVCTLAKHIREQWIWKQQHGTQELERMILLLTLMHALIEIIDAFFLHYIIALLKFQTHKSRWEDRTH